MLEIVINRIIQGLLSAVGLGTVFYLLPVFRHIFSKKYRSRFEIEDYGKHLFQIETIKFLRMGLIYGFIYGFVAGNVIGRYGDSGLFLIFTNN